MRGAAGGRKSLNRRVSEPDFGKKALPVTQNFQPGKVREVVADWNKVSRTEAVNHDCPIKLLEDTTFDPFSDTSKLTRRH